MSTASRARTSPRLGLSAWNLVLLAVAGLAALLPLPAAGVERWFSTGLFPLLQSVLTLLSNPVPFALLDVLGGVVVVWWILSLCRDFSRSGVRTWRAWAVVMGRLTIRTATVAAVAYLVFLALWGLNYRRVALADRFITSAEAATPERAEQLAAQAVNELNRLFSAAHAPGQPESPTASGSLAEAFRRTQSVVGVGRPARPAVPKATLLDYYFRSAGVAGMTDPYFLETLVATDLLPVERPFVVAHEWSHLAGFADEGEANFLGWLTCVRGGPLDQYSGWLSVYAEVVGGLPRPSRARLAARLNEGPREDLLAIADRLRRNVRPRVANAGWQVYDQYLKANRVEAGSASYGEVVALVLRTQFGPNWEPLLR